MKTTILLFVLLFAFLHSWAQDYVISFAGTGGSSTVETVNVQNLTQGTNLTLSGTDVLHLVNTLGIDLLSVNNDNPLRIYPNPMTETSSVEFYATASGVAAIELFDITGKLVVLFQHNFQSGIHTFALSGLSTGVYLLRVKSENYFYKGELVCKSTSMDHGKIDYEFGIIKSESRSKVKSMNSIIPMQYNDGDQLLFTGSSGIYTTVIPLVPIQSQTVTFNFVSCTDADSNNYPTVTIGTQLWMAKNLNVGTRIDGYYEQTNNGTSEKYCFNDLDSNCTVYGGLYQWNELMQYITTEGAKGICPVGWHIPTDAEWTTLITFLGGQSFAGGKIKETGRTHWSWSYPPYPGPTNSSGFTALGAGYRHFDGSYYFSTLTYNTYFYSSSQNGNTDPGYVFLAADNDYFIPGWIPVTWGFSCRCLKD